MEVESAVEDGWVLADGREGPISESVLELSSPSSLAPFFGSAGGCAAEFVEEGPGREGPIARACLGDATGEELRERFAGGDAGGEDEELRLRFERNSGGSVGPIVAIVWTMSWIKLMTVLMLKEL